MAQSDSVPCGFGWIVHTGEAGPFKAGWSHST